MSDTVEFGRSYPSSHAQPVPPRVDARPAVLLAIDLREASRYPAGMFTPLLAQTTDEVLRCIDRTRPRLLVLDWDLPTIDAPRVCTIAAARSALILVSMEHPAAAPAALKAGCHAVLLKPFAPNLAAARLGRLYRESLLPPPGRTPVSMERATRRTWADVCCPGCGAGSAVGFDYSSHRRMWFACLSCDHVWLGPRRE